MPGPTGLDLGLKRTESGEIELKLNFWRAKIEVPTLS